MSYIPWLYSNIIPNQIGVAYFYEILLTIDLIYYLYLYQMHQMDLYQSPVEHLRWSLLQKLLIALF